MERATFGRRLAAGLCDSLLFTPVIFVIYKLADPMLFKALIPVLALAYAYLEVSHAQTLGKRFLGIAIRGQDGLPAPRSFLLKRYLIKMTPAILTLLAILLAFEPLNLLSTLASMAFNVGALLALNEERLAGHDRIVGTAVYKIS